MRHATDVKLTRKLMRSQNQKGPMLFSKGVPGVTGPFCLDAFTRERTAARKLAAEYFQRFPKDRYQTAVESWRELQSQNIEFTMKRLREPIERATEIAK